MYTAEKARRYQDQPDAKHRAEMRLIDRAFALIPREHRVLDAPCGGGRVSVHLARRGYRLRAADLSEAMIDSARQTMAAEGLQIDVDHQDVECVSYQDRAFDTVVSFRLFHHFPTPEIRRRVVHELCRVAASNVVLSYLSPWAFTSARNRLVAACGGRPVRKFATSLGEVEGYFAENGFRLVADFARLPLVHTLHLAVFQRIDTTASS
jgi:2-polyprenyl-3-methyl-5-hydroxy-6-metoxy-1,4-benzoquinol methylase